jgi:hypothetical protein
MDDLEAAWAELHDATSPGWFVDRPGQRYGGQWEQYAFDQTEKAHIGKRSREWTAVGETEVECGALGQEGTGRVAHSGSGSEIVVTGRINR